MILTYLQFCRPGNPFYDLPADDGAEEPFPLHVGPPPDGWTRTRRNEWVMHMPISGNLRDQGWKIHVTTTVDGAPEVLDRVSAYCLQHQVAFKALAGPVDVSRRNSKYADRGGSGKFITIYPADDDEFARLLHDLDALVGGRPGPTILSDLRWAQGPLFVRYGAFRSRRMEGPEGREIECILDPSGQLVPDERRPGFHPPAWARVPEVLAPALQARQARTLEGFPYAVQRAVHFSNGGGVYLAERRDDGRKILLKEARPHSGLDETNRDATARLKQERSALSDLSGIPGIPRVDDYVTGVEHVFLGREYVEGRTLLELSCERNPLINPESRMNRAEYRAWIERVLAQVGRTLDLIHRAGYVFGDLHPGNLIVAADDSVHLIDFESSSTDTTGFTQAMGVVGFRAPEHIRGHAVDRFALGCLRIALLLPLTRLTLFGGTPYQVLIRCITEEFDLSADYLTQVHDLVGRHLETPETAIDEELTPVAFARAVAVTATGERVDRLYPGDVRQYLEAGGGLTLGHGASGVLWALNACGQEWDPAHVAWFGHRLAEEPDLPIGFWSGWAGIAYGLQPGAPELAEQAWRSMVKGVEETDDVSLARGLSGAGLALLELADRDFEDDALIEVIGQKIRTIAGDQVAPGLRAGLHSGGSGVALLALRLAARTADPAYRALADTHLKADIATFGLEPGARISPAGLPALGAGLANGIAGLGLVLLERAQLVRNGLIPVAGPDESLDTALTRINTAVRQTVAMHGGLLSGRAGLAQYLLFLDRDHHRPGNWPGLDLKGADGYPLAIGDESLKYSMDLGSGLAGLAVTAEAFRQRRPILPLFSSGSSR